MFKALGLFALVIAASVAANASVTDQWCPEINGTFQPLVATPGQTPLVVKSVHSVNGMVYAVRDAVFFADNENHPATKMGASYVALTSCTRGGFAILIHDKSANLTNNISMKIQVINKHGDISLKVKQDKRSEEAIFIKGESSDTATTTSAK